MSIPNNITLPQENLFLVPAMESPISLIMANLFMMAFELRTINKPPNPPILEMVCGWYLCHPKNRIQKWVPAAHQLHGHPYPVDHSIDQTRWSHSLSGYSRKTWTRQNFVHNSEQENKPYRSIFTLGQPPQPLLGKVCLILSQRTRTVCSNP